MENWDDLRLFLEVGRHRKLDDAAVKIGQDPTTVSRRLRRLEKNLGVTLFERTRRGHLLTPQGQALSEQVELIEQTAMTITNELGGPTTQASGKVRLSVPEGFGTAVIAPRLREFLNNYPAITVDLVASSGFLSVSKREADMSILLTRPEGGRVNVKKLTDYHLHLYANPAYLAQNGIPQKPADLTDHSLIGYVDDLIYSPKLRYYDEVLKGLAPSLCSSSLLAQQQMTRAGCGIAILPKFMAGEDSNLVPVLAGQVQVTRNFWLATHEDLSAHARIRSLEDFLVESVSDHERFLSG